MFNYKTSVWENKYTIIENKITDSPVIQILPDAHYKNILVFQKDGFAYLVDENLRVLDGFMVSEHPITCVEEIKPKNKMRVFLVADQDNNLFSFNSSLGGKRLVKKTPSPVTAIEDLGDKRILISYYDDNSTTRLEMITPMSGNHLSSLKLVSTQRIVDFACPTSLYGKKDGWLLAASDKSIMTIHFKGHQLEKSSSRPAKDNFYIDEIVCDVIEQHAIGKEVYPKNGPEFDNVVYVSDETEKVSTITDRFGAKVITEGNNLFIKCRSEEINLHVQFDEGVSFRKHRHWPLGRVILSGNDSVLRIVDWRSNCSKFFFSI